MHFLVLFMLKRRVVPRARLFPYTTLFRSDRAQRCPDQPGPGGPARHHHGRQATHGLALRSCRAEAHDPGWPLPVRSEEHTSELQSHSDLVCRLLLEKKKKDSTRHDSFTST